MSSHSQNPLSSRRRRFFMALGVTLVIGFLLFSHWQRLPHGALVVEVLDVGQGDSILITTPHGQRVLVDGGPGQSVLRELGAAMPFLNRRIDWVILTHPHADHVEGLVPILQRYEVSRLMLTGVTYSNAAYDALLLTARISVPPIPVMMGDSHTDFLLDDVFFDVLYPFESALGGSLGNVNNSSLVIAVEYGGRRLLLTGDAEFEVEEELISAHDRGAISLNADVLKAGHHGSRTSSTPNFIDRVKPQVAIVSSGRGNSYGHPHPETLEIFKTLGIEVRRTDQEGRIRLEFQ